MGRPRKDDVEQNDLIPDLHGPEAKLILRKARAYLKAKQECHDCNEDAKKKLNALRDAVKEAKLTPIEGGVIRVRCENQIVELIPQQEKVRIKTEGESSGDDDGNEADDES